MKSDERIKYFYKENTGVSDTRNYGVNQAMGEYIIFVDSDDYLDIHMIETSVNALEESKADLVLCGFYEKNLNFDRVSKAEEEELQLQIKEKEIIFRQINRDLREDAADTNADKTEEQELAVTATENIRKEDKQEEDKQEEDKQEEDKQEREEQQRKLQIRTGGEDRGHQIDQEWEQIRSSCHKVEDCRELGEVYRVNKGNFAVLPESMKHILQNSFLVHGLMNYGYLLLFRVDEKARQFGVGVPGVYYEKEKLVAEMFGFPQFWCDGRSDNGKFGYYLRIVS